MGETEGARLEKGDRTEGHSREAWLTFSRTQLQRKLDRGGSLTRLRSLYGHQDIRKSLDGHPTVHGRENTVPCLSLDTVAAGKAP